MAPIYLFVNFTAHLPQTYKVTLLIIQRFTLCKSLKLMADSCALDKFSLTPLNLIPAPSPLKFSGNRKYMLRDGSSVTFHLFSSDIRCEHT